MTQNPDDATQKKLIESIMTNIGQHGTPAEIAKAIGRFDRDEEALNKLITTAKGKQKWDNGKWQADESNIRAIAKALVEHDKNPTAATAPKAIALAYLHKLNDSKLMQNAASKYAQNPSVLLAISKSLSKSDVMAAFNLAALDVVGNDAPSQAPSTLKESVSVNATPLKIKKPEGGTP